MEYQEKTTKTLDGVEIKYDNCYNRKVWTFPKKGYARIYVEKKEDIEKVKEIIKAMDEEEFKYYFFDDLIAVFEGTINTVYCHKFCDLDIGFLMENCWKLGIKMFAIEGRYGDILFY